MKLKGLVPLARRLSYVLLVVGFASAGPGVTALTGTPFSDAFDVPGTMLDISKWTTEFGSPAVLGRTHLRDWVAHSGANPFVVAAGAAQLALDTFNAGSALFSGSHAKSLASFRPNATTDFILSARVRLTTLQPGLVFGIYFYGCGQDCAARHDELDIEILTNYLQPGLSPLRVQLNRYAAEPLGAGHGPIVNLPVGFDPLAYHDWTIRWAVDRVTFSVDGQELFTAISFIPQGPMQADMIVWAPSSDWADAYHASLQPASSSNQNQRFMALVDAVSVSATSHVPAPASKTLLVTNNNDSGPGSLRQTIADAVAGDTIAFSPGLSGVVTLASGEIVISKDLTISGPGFNLLTISGNHASRIFTTAGGHVTIGGLKFVSGVAPDFGGSISNSGGLAIADCVFQDNFAGALGDGRGQGGAVWSTGSLTVLKSLFLANRSTGNGGAIRSSGALVVERSTFNGNRANYYGGGIYSLGAGTLSDSIFTGNQAGTGGGIWNENQPMRIANSTISGGAASVGGGLATKWGAVTALNTTFSGNTAASGGGISFAFGPGGTVTLINSTIVGNQATTSTGGGGVYVTGTLKLLNSIVAMNTVPPVGIGPDIAGTAVSLGHNLVGNASGAVGLVHGMQGDLVGSSMAPLDPTLGPLADNGGMTKTHAVQPGSPAVDAGDRLVLGSPYLLASDQRGGSRSVGVAPDIGSFESSATPPVVSTITAQPASQTIAPRRTARLCVTTGGVSPHLYQWYAVSGASRQLIAGATSACFTTPPLVVSGDYLVRVSDLTTTIDSEIARVTVTAQSSDFNGDGRADAAVFKPGSGMWSIQGQANRQFGLPGDMPVPGDYDGDGHLDLAVYRPSTGEWFIQGRAPIQWGRTADLPVPADYDGDGVTDIAVFRTTDGPLASWFVRGQFTRSFGVRGDVPLPADYDGDGRADLAVYRRPTSTWHLAYSTTDFVTVETFQRGLAGDVPIAGMFDGDRRADLAMFRPSTGGWDLAFAATDYSTSAAYVWGVSGDVPLAVDADGDGVDELVVYRPADATWWTLSRMTGATTVQQHGAPGDWPVAERPHLPVTPTADFDGDGRADVTVFRPSTGVWYTRLSSTNFGSITALQWGLPGDLHVPGDYDGDRRTDLAVYRPATGVWHLRLSSTGFAASRAVQWGVPGDVPAPADYDGDGRTDPAVYRPATGQWFVRLSSTDYLTSVVDQWGLSSDVPLPADYDGDGRADLAVFRPPTGQWFLKLTTSAFGAVIVKQFGLPTDVPQAADFDGDGRADLVVYRPGTGEWFSLDALTSVNAIKAPWGLSGDIPVPHDFDGDGVADSAVFRPATGEWWVKLSSTGGVLYVQWGLAADKPAASGKGEVR